MEVGFGLLLLIVVVVLIEISGVLRELGALGRVCVLALVGLVG